LMKRFNTLFFLAFLFSFSSLAQTVFIHSNSLLQEKDQHSGVPVAVTDMNGDGLDDIVTLDLGHILYVQYQTPDPARPFVRYEVERSVDIQEQNDICVADFNNDGLNDIFTIGSYDKAKVYYANKGSYHFTLQTITNLSFFSQGASTGDFNHDGWVDVVILNDNAVNFTLINDGTGNLVKQDFFDFITVPASDNSGNYGSVYSDFDMDGDLDLYIAKCRQGVNDPSDPRRIDMLFVNDGTGHYVQDAASYGLADGHQTWTADFGDFDNDGDLDLFKTQHDIISELDENIDNETFIDITNGSGLNINGIPLQGMFCDFDNDGYQDILVSGDAVKFYHNNGDKTFTEEAPFAPVIFGSFALGDLNHDGFMDVYASRVIPFNQPDPLREDILYLNQGNNNHFIGLHLVDPEHNYAAIGAMARIYGPWGVQVKEVRGGEQYGVSNSHAIVFGLGQSTTYDSLIVRWPDGTIEHYDGLVTDTYLTLTKGECPHNDQQVFPFLQALCNGDSTVLKVNPSLNVIEWSTGSTADSITVNTAGLYYAIVEGNDQCRFKTMPIEIATDPDTLKPVLDYGGALAKCNGETGVISVTPGLSYTWSNGDTTQQIVVGETGDYYALVHGYCRDQYSDTLTLTFIVPDAPVVENDTVPPGESATLHAIGDSIVWYYDPNGVSVIGSGPTFTIDDLNDTVTVYAANLGILEGTDYGVGPISQQGNTKYNANFVNGGQLFEVYEPIIIHQITVFTDSVGIRSIEISDGNSIIFQKHVTLDAGATVVNLNVELPVGSYTMGTNTNDNLAEFGTNSPYLWRSSEGVLYPYEIPEVMSITNSTYGETFYYYFYDWKISTQDQYCNSDLVPVTAILDLGSAVNPVFSSIALPIVPNPTREWLKLILESNDDAQIEIAGADGQARKQLKITGISEQSYLLDLNEQAPGIYWIRVVQNGKSYVGRVVKL
ncbi:MAG TPA: FG-GAP-like repeat-containing protein, partial [Saprospiraceae bacterium]|nr:FG-GAP-like repeat-containing protein [Saprospiraceae bacterium]